MALLHSVIAVKFKYTWLLQKFHVRHFTLLEEKRKNVGRPPRHKGRLTFLQSPGVRRAHLENLTFLGILRAWNMKVNDI